MFRVIAPPPRCVFPADDALLLWFHAEVLIRLVGNLTFSPFVPQRWAGRRRRRAVEPVEHSRCRGRHRRVGVLLSNRGRVAFNPRRVQYRVQIVDPVQKGIVSVKVHRMRDPRLAIAPFESLLCEIRQSDQCACCAM